MSFDDAKHYEDQTVPCKWCGKPTTYLGTKECDPCHNAVRGLSHLLASENGRQYVRGELAGIEDHEMVPAAALAEVRERLDAIASGALCGEEAQRECARAALAMLGPKP